MSCSAGSTRARASSGSRFSSNSVEPLRSANSTVTNLRSPSDISSVSADTVTALVGVDTAGDFGWLALGTLASAGALLKAAPLSFQNLAPGRLDDPHEGHCIGRGAPHVSQNLALLECSESQLGQCIEQRVWYV